MTIASNPYQPTGVPVDFFRVIRGNQSYRMRSGVRNVAVACLVVFLAAWMGVLLNRPTDHWMFVANMSIVWGAVSLGCIVMLLAYQVYQIDLNESSIRFRGLVSDYEIGFDAIEEARWRTDSAAGRVTLRSGGRLLIIDFAMHHARDRERMVTHLRNHIPSSVHENWNRFEQMHQRRMDDC